MTDKFDSLFEKTAEKMGDKKTIDLKGSDIDQKGAKKMVTIPAKSTAKEKTQKKDKRITSYLTESEYEAFIESFKPLEKVADRVRDLILEDIRKRRSNAKSDDKVLTKDVWVKKKMALAKNDKAYLTKDVWVKINEPLAEKWMVRISISLTNKEAEAFAEFLKRVHFINYRNNAKSDDKAYLMQDVWFKINKALAEKWFEPR